jgi:hypothetical protein
MESVWGIGILVDKPRQGNLQNEPNFSLSHCQAMDHWGHL